MVTQYSFSHIYEGKFKNIPVFYIGVICNKKSLLLHLEFSFVYA